MKFRIALRAYPDRHADVGDQSRGEKGREHDVGDLVGGAATCICGVLCPLIASTQPIREERMVMSTKRVHANKSKPSVRSKAPPGFRRAWSSNVFSVLNFSPNSGIRNPGGKGARHSGRNLPSERPPDVLAGRRRQQTFKQELNFLCPLWGFAISFLQPLPIFEMESSVAEARYMTFFYVAPTGAAQVLFHFPFHFSDK